MLGEFTPRKSRDQEVSFSPGFATSIPSAPIGDSKEQVPFGSEGSFGIQVHPAMQGYGLIRHSKLRSIRRDSIRYSPSSPYHQTCLVPDQTPPDQTPSNQLPRPSPNQTSTEPPHCHRSTHTTGPYLPPNGAPPNQMTASPDCFSPGPPAAIYFQDPCPLPHSINRGAGVQQWQTSLRAQTWKELSNNFHTLVLQALYL